MMKNVIRNIYGSFLPDKARKELFAYLSANRYIRREIICEIIKEKVEYGKIPGDNATGNQAEDIKNYVVNNKAKINEECDEILKELCKQCIPGFDWLVILKHIGLFAILVVPAIIYLLTDILQKFTYCSMAVQPSEVVALLFLVILIVIVGAALILYSFKD